MKVKILPDWQSKLAQYNAKIDVQLFVNPESHYEVYGLSWRTPSSVFGTPCLLCEIMDDYGNLTSAPIDLFEVIEREVPWFWRTVTSKDAVLLWPDAFLREYFHDDYSNDDPEALLEFEKLQSQIAHWRANDPRLASRS